MDDETFVSVLVVHVDSGDFCIVFFYSITYITQNGSRTGLYFLFVADFIWRREIGRESFPEKLSAKSQKEVLDWLKLSEALTVSSEAEAAAWSSVILLPELLVKLP